MESAPLDSAALRSRSVLLTGAALIAMLALGRIGYDLYLAERPVPPTPGSQSARLGPPLTDRLVVIVVDALREDIAGDATVMPAWARIAERGASGVSVTPPMTLTTMSVLNMGTGMTPSISWSLKNFDAEPFEDESVLRLLHDTGRHIALLGDASWTQLFGGAADHTLSIQDSGFYKGADDDMIATDAQVFDEAEVLLADPRWDVIIVHVVGTDKAAHAHGAHRREEDGSLSMYGRRAAAIDARIGRLLDQFGDRGTWLVTADHGATLAGNHGGGEAEARRAPFALAGPGIVPQRSVEQPLNALAPTLAALMGVRPPRTAEVPATFSLLTLEPRAQARQVLAQLMIRERYAASALALAGVTVELPPGRSAEGAQRELDLGRPQKAVVMASNGMGFVQTLLDATEEGRTGRRALGMAFGLALMIGLLWLLARESGAPDPLRPALAWGALSWALLYFGDWQFTVVWLLGELGRSWGHFAWHGSVLAAGIAALAVVVWLVRRSRALMAARPEWVAWAVLILFLGQSVMRWPYGPLEQTWALLLVAALGLVAWAHRRDRAAVARVAVALALLAALRVLSPILLAGGEGRLEDTLATTVAANGALGLAAVALALRGGREGRWAWTSLIALGVSAAICHALSLPWLLKTVIPALIVPFLLLPRSSTPGRRFELVLVTALVLYRALSLDARVLLLVLLAGAAWSLSGLRTRGRASVAMAAALVMLAWQSYFLAIGHAWSFSAIDVTVAFAATREALNLGEGFALILAQHLAPWLVLVAAAVHQRVASDDAPSLRPLAIALAGGFVVQAFGAFASFEYELDNHWFTMHAVPLFVFALCNALLVGLALAASGAVLPSRRSGAAALAALLALAGLSGCADQQDASGSADTIVATGDDTAPPADTADVAGRAGGAGATDVADAGQPTDAMTDDAADAADAADDAAATPCGLGTIKGLPCTGPAHEGATIRVEAPGCDGAEVIAETTTDATGAFLLPGVPSGAQRVFVSTSEKTTSFTTFVHPNSVTVLAPTITGTCGGEVPQAPCPVGTVIGSVCPPGGSTIAAGGTQVLIGASDCPSAQALVQTVAAPNGVFSLKDVPAGVRTVNVLPPGAETPWLHTVFVSAGKENDIGALGAIGCGGVGPLPSESPEGPAEGSPDDILCTDPKWNLCGKDILTYCANPTPPYPDCNGDGVPDPCPQCPPIDVVFVLDTSGSMSDEIDALCATIQGTVDKLLAADVGANSTIYGISDTSFQCTKSSVFQELGAAIPDPPQGFQPIGSCGDGSEDWGAATAVVSVHHPWTPGALRLVVPISDEGPACGDPINEEDSRAITAAIEVANANGVIVSPISGTDSSEEVIALAKQLALGTGGQWSLSADPALDIATSVVLSVLKACTKVNDCNGNGLPDSCDLASGALVDLDGNGIGDACQ